MKPLKRPRRRAVLVIHISASAGWLGLTLGLLALATTAITTDSGTMTEAAARSMKVFTDWLVLPLALLTLLSGLTLALGTPWGLLRHRWVVTKFCITLVTVTASVFALRPGVDHAVRSVASGAPLPSENDLVMGPIVSFSAYLLMTVISVLKPWGLTRRGRRLRAGATSRKTLDERSPGQTV
ncbi:DUF2269 domain-containing protein [Streptomyces sp. NPDC051018]|uniref:DUF2269 domain-containing protein n=1 Tax=Streptomyces sp. NPDC051018 TaxID=3365639 RepID=UPI0037914DBF